MKLYNEDCLKILATIPDESVDCVVTEYDFTDFDYFVSDMGRFRKGNNVKEVKPDSVGTKTYSLNGKRFKLHQIIMQTFYPEGIENGYSVDHINRIRTDNRISNLRWADKKSKKKIRQIAELIRNGTAEEIADAISRLFTKGMDDV